MYAPTLSKLVKKHKNLKNSPGASQHPATQWAGAALARRDHRQAKIQGCSMGDKPCKRLGQGCGCPYLTLLDFVHPKQVGRSRI